MGPITKNAIKINMNRAAQNEIPLNAVVKSHDATSLIVRINMNKEAKINR